MKLSHSYSVDNMLPCLVALWRLVMIAPSLVTHSVDSVVAPNHFLGTCLTQEWALETGATLNIDISDRNADGQLEHPFLHKALPQRRFRVEDPRTSSRKTYTAADIPDGAVIYGVGATVDATTGSLTSRGTVNGSLILELSGWSTHSLATLVFSIIAYEVYGYPVSHYSISDTLTTAQRMSSVFTGKTTPTHANLEVWVAGIEAELHKYVNESLPVGGIGYFGRSGLYTTVDFIQSSLQKTPPLFANFYKGYEVNEDLITAVPVSGLQTSKFFPPDKIYCEDDSYGCRGNCSMTHACKLREDQHGECAVVVMMYDYFDPGYLQAVMSNINIPAYFCFLGYDGVQNFVLDAQKNSRPVLFYHYEPDLFHVTYPGLFDRVFLPRSVPERVVLATGKFGENGYGGKTNNPVDVDFPVTTLTKYAAAVLQNDRLLGRFVTQYVLSELHINDLLRKYLSASKSGPNGEPAEEDPTFHAACSWLKENYEVWRLWLDRLPLCDFHSHMTYEISGCNNTDQRTITFAWRLPSPEDHSLPYECDGGMFSLPASIQTSRSCEWLLEDDSRWTPWIDDKPVCDSTFFTYRIADCDSSANRIVKYWWRLPNPNNTSQSLECRDGDSLPEDVSIDCDYMPYMSPGFVGITATAGLLMVIIVVCIVFVFVNRNAPIIKRSQYEFLLTMLVGGVLTCVAAILYAGEPNAALCVARPLVLSGGFTSIFGSLLVKSLRVYRVFMRSAFKKKTVSAGLMFKLFLGMHSIDVVIIGIWYIVDKPTPHITMNIASEFLGEVDLITCESRSVIFTAVLFFWKAVVLLVGLYLSFLIRKISADFQESLWIFASCLVVLVACVLLLPLAYMVQLSAVIFYLFLSVILLICTAVVMGLMIIPKLKKMRVADVNSSSGKSLPSLRSRKTTNVSQVSRAEFDRVETERDEDEPKRSSTVAELRKPSEVDESKKVMPGPRRPTVTNILPFVPDDQPASKTSSSQHEVVPR
ncbi:hypothetical protein Poli38472_002403 [Pythium oligandrum]|uniref:G-protein coupled receptors family 3 profile domain-containing protein n=1 Tax=Pythium oligandrum TaxID=41045 RepID=A0A8K1CJP2_PYTOL|nr:hypothetical protein Poli38472_002403 [Pythium oligandrum]|eukprot:TMW63462.1 hypothetical protein Poli38472_002403 [Pythium oligandrum]